MDKENIDEVETVTDFSFYIVNNLHDNEAELLKFVEVIRNKLRDSDLNEEELVISLGEWANDFILEKQNQKVVKVIQIMFELSQKGGPAFHLAAAYERLGEKEKAFNYYLKSSEIRMVRLGKYHESTLASVDETIRLYEELEKFDFELPGWFEEVVVTLNSDNSPKKKRNFASDSFRFQKTQPNKTTKAASNPTKDVWSKIEELKELKALLDDGVIDQEEFNTMKAEIMNKY